jgi:hypothetical protein
MNWMLALYAATALICGYALDSTWHKLCEDERRYAITHHKP